SMELAGATCFWAAVLALVQRRGRPDADLELPPGALRERTLRWFALAGGVALVTPRLSGPIWVAVAGALSLLTVERAAWWPVLRRQLLSVALPIVAAGTAVVAWALVFHSYQVFAALRPITDTFHQMVVKTFWN